MGVMFFVGIVVGWAITYWLLNRSWQQKVSGMKRAIAQRHQQELLQAQQRTEEWSKHSQHLQKTLQSSETTHQELTTQLELQLQVQQETIHALTQEKGDLLKQVETHTLDHQRTLNEWQQKVELDHQRTLDEWRQKVETAQKDAEELLSDLLQKEQEIEHLNLSHQKLSMEFANINEELREELRQLKYSPIQDSATESELDTVGISVDSHEHITNQIMEHIQDDNLMESLSEVLARFFPTVDFLRDSMQAIAHVYTAHNPHFGSLISAITHIRNSEYQDLRKYQKIHATNDQWSECRVPHISLLRLYFQKCTQENGYQIWVSQKHDKKTQKRDFAWLDNQSTC